MKNFFVFLDNHYIDLLILLIIIFIIDLFIYKITIIITIPIVLIASFAVFRKLRSKIGN